MSEAAGIEKVTKVKVFEATSNGTIKNLVGTLDLETGVIHWTAEFQAKDVNSFFWWSSNKYQYFGLYLNVIAGAGTQENITVTDASGNTYTLDNGLYNNEDSYSRTQRAPSGEWKKQSLGSNINTLDYTGRYWGQSYSTTEKIDVSGPVTIEFDTQLGDYENWGKTIANVAVSIQATSSSSASHYSSDVGDYTVHPTVGESTSAEATNRGVVVVS